MKKIVFAAFAGIALNAAAANATIVTVFDSIPDGTAAFNATVSGAGSTALTSRWESLTPGTSVDFGDYVLTRNDGGTIYSEGIYSYFTGESVSINPGFGPDFKQSGVTLTFDAAINAIGFEVGDWGTCCQPSALYISFDDGDPIKVGESLTYGDVFLTEGYPSVFVAALDDSGSFTKVSFWGDGWGEYLVFGGTIRYALLEGGSLPPEQVSEPATLGLLGMGLLGFAGLRRRKA